MKISKRLTTEEVIKVAQEFKDEDVIVFDGGAIIRPTWINNAEVEASVINTDDHQKEGK